jgi:GH24 family phage-related lysozyme (muramidase)
MKNENTNTQNQELETLSTNLQKQRPYSSTNIPLIFEEDDDIDAIMERYHNLSDEEQLQTKRELCEYYGDKLETERTTHNIHTPEFIYSTGDKQKDEEKMQNILSRCAGSLAKNPNCTISIEEFKRRFKLEREARKEYYGSNPYINAMHDAFIKTSILNRVQYKEQYNSPEAIELANLLGYKPAYEDPNLQPKQYASNTLSQTQSDTSIENENFNESFFINTTMFNFLKAEEGYSLYPYIDTSGITTIGIGTNIEKNTDKLPWYYLDPQTNKLRFLDKNNSNDKKILEEELNKLNKYKTIHNDEAKMFENRTNLRLSAEYVHELYLKRVKTAINDIRSIIDEKNKKTHKKIPIFEKLPHQLQIVLVDMAYNLGKDGFNYYLKKLSNGKQVGYPNFWNALALHDIDKMIKESQRFSNAKPLTKRNNKIKNLLEEIRSIYNKK